MFRFLESTAARYMTSAVKSVTRQCSMGELETLFAQYDFDALPVVEDGKMLGIVTKFDFLRAFRFTTGQLVPSYDELMKRTVGDVMTEGIVHVEPTTSMTRVLQLMVNLKLRSFPVLGPDRQLLGMISRGDVVGAQGLRHVPDVFVLGVGHLQRGGELEGVDLDPGVFVHFAEGLVLVHGDGSPPLEHFFGRLASGFLLLGSHGRPAAAGRS